MLDAYLRILQFIMRDFPTWLGTVILMTIVTFSLTIVLQFLFKGLSDLYSKRIEYRIKNFILKKEDKN